MRDYEDLGYAFEELKFAAAFYDAGKLDTYIRNMGDRLDCIEGFLWYNFYEILDAIGDFYDVRENEEYFVSRMYFSDQCIRDYFGMVQDRAEKAGIPMKQDHYYKKAYEYFSRTMLGACPYSCWFRLVTQTHHEYGYGISIWVSCEEFYDWPELLFALLEMVRFFSQEVKLMKENESLSSGMIVPFSPKLKTGKEAA